MKILIVGLGAIGQRHATNAAEFADEIAVCDQDIEKLSEFSNTFTNFDEALAWQPDGVIIAVPHQHHLEIASKVIKAGAVPLIEKPLSHTLDGVSKFLKTIEDNRGRAYVVCNMRYHQAVAALKTNLGRVGKVLYARAQYGNYLPNMRPDADYKKLYCAHKEQGGGVILDAIHEINYLNWLFGNTETVQCTAAKLSDLDIDVEDYASITVKHETGTHSEIHLDYLQQCKRRGCEIVGTNGTLIWESTNKNPEHCNVRFYDAKTKEWATLFEDNQLDPQHMYKELIKAFSEELQNENSRPDLLTAKQAAHDLKTCIAAHQAAQTGHRQELA